MDTKCNICSSKLENMPILDDQCYVDLTTAKPIADNSKRDRNLTTRSQWNFNKRYKLLYFIQILLIILVLCFVGYTIYLTVESGYIKSKDIYEINHSEKSIIFKSSVEDQPNDPSLLSMYKYTYSGQAPDISHDQLESIILRKDHSRLKRNITPCKQNMEHCKTVINSMWSIVSIVNSSMPHLQALLQNFSTDTSASKSKFIELVECLQCKNDSITFIDESQPKNFKNHPRMMYDHSDHVQIKNNVDTVNNLLNEEEHNIEKQNSSITSISSTRNFVEIDPIRYDKAEDTTQTSNFNVNSDELTTLSANKKEENTEEFNKNVNFIEVTSLSTDKKEQITEKSHAIVDKDNFDGNQRKDSRIQPVKEAEIRSSTIRSMDNELTSTSTEAEMINATMTTLIKEKAEETTTPTNIINDTERTVVTVNVTTKPDESNVTEMASVVMHPSVHPLGQGYGQSELEREGENALNGSTKVEFREFQRRVVNKENLYSGIIPTAETIKSTQQLQLTPTMSWMPYPVCFYGPAANSPVKQSGPGQMMYPASSPGVSYPVSMPQQRQGFQNPNQSPSYVQVQAQSVQFLPMQSHSNFGGQKMGPTGPGAQNFPIFPGQQTFPNSGPSSSGKSPYYCTYIPAPTFQFPAIPGVSEYQRSTGRTTADKNLVDEDKKVVKENKTNNQMPPFYRGYPEMCPFNTIPCGDGKRCILRSQRCDGQVDCNDASDETMCSCRDRISQERLCDGYFDCPQGEDELGCLGCSKTSFSCNDWQRRYAADNCVPLSQRCDGVKQCNNGKDEMDCNILTPLHIEGKSVFTIGYAEGYLHKNFKGHWYPVCTAIESWAKDACNSEIGSESKEAPEIKIHSIPDKAYEGPYLAEVGGQIKLIPSCMSTAVFVRCPRFPCGTRVLSQEDTLRPNVLEKEDKKSLMPIDELIWSSFDYQIDPRFTKNSENSSEQDDIVGSQLRVVGGRASKPNAWPFLVAIYKDGLFYCGGVIVNELWVLTAAHCLDGFPGHYFEVQAGILRRFSFSPMAQIRRAHYTVIHPQYSSISMKNDIGMLNLDYPFYFNRWVRPVCLPGLDLLGSMWRHKPEPNTTCIAIGWGVTTEEGPDPDHLREVEVPILSNCKHEIDQNEAAICAGYSQGGRDACQGDSGGPLLCRNPYSESQWYVAGVVSHGEGCGRPHEPGTYTRVSYFLNWIQEISSGQGVPPLIRRPLEKCPGFSCKGGLGKCLPIQARCNRIVDCLDGEDEINCRNQYPIYRKSDNADPEVKPGLSIEADNSTLSDITTSEISTSSTLIIDNAIDATTEKSTTATIDNIELEYGDDDDDDNKRAFSSNEAENNSSPAPISFPTIFTCARLLQTIPIGKRCNRVVDCEDGTDEMNCKCKEFLLNIKPNAICDSYVDCEDQTDEEDCKICAEDEFLCRTSKTCIPMSKKCDGYFDCEYREDELSCFTLTDGQNVYWDANEQPFLNTQGVLTRYSKNKWQPVCHRPKLHQGKSTAVLIGQNMCEYFGFASLQSSESIPIRNSTLKEIAWHTENLTYHENSLAASLNADEETCPGLYIRCTPVLSGSVAAHLVVDANTGSRDYLWPWLAAIFVDGHYRCSALLLDHNWLLSTTKCFENIRLDENYTTAVLGYGPLFRYINGPHQQISIIDEMHSVNNSVAILLHLKDRINFSRQVRPLFLDKTIYLPGANDTCIAVGTNENYETRSIFLRPILQNCPSCQRCYVNASSSECSGTEMSVWSGTIFCRGKKGWYPAAVFQDNKGACNFKDTRTMTSIDYINPYLIEAMDGPRQSIEATCYGYRCKIGQCITQNRVCDGIPDCRNQEDEDSTYCDQFRENCENNVEGCSCMKTELRCGNGKCVNKSAFCDGKVDCFDGSDEPTTCTCAEYLKLTYPERICDGVRHCVDKTDESPEMCPCRDTSFKCKTTNGNETCIPQDFICDGANDCPDGEDEATCRMLKQDPDDSDKSGEVIRRSYGVWHSECFSNPLSSKEEASNLCKSMGYSSGRINNDTIVKDEPAISKLDDFYLVQLNDWTWMTLRDDKPLVTLEKSNATCHRAFVNCT